MDPEASVDFRLPSPLQNCFSKIGYFEKKKDFGPPLAILETRSQSSGSATAMAPDKVLHVYIRDIVKKIKIKIYINEKDTNYSVNRQDIITNQTYGQKDKNKNRKR